jgi:hypothetical protein
LPIKYLGHPLGAPFEAKFIWRAIIKKIERRLAAWKRFYLPKGGQLTLIKSTLPKLPIYFLSLFPIQVSIANQTEKLLRDILWGDLDSNAKFHLVNWKKVCTPHLGVLRIRSLLTFNQALLGK